MGGRVVSPGTTGRGSYDHVRVEVSRPSWLVLGEGYNRGWRASCDGHSLGTPTPLDGYANAWRVSAGCRDASFVFAPNRLALAGYLVSALAGILCLLLIAVGWRRGGRHSPQSRRGSRGATASRPGRPGARLRGRCSPLLPSDSCSVSRPGLVALPAIAFVLWRGIGARPLILLAAALLVIVVPIVYLVHPGDESGGNHAAYAISHLGAHWVGVAAAGFLMGALWRTLNGLRIRRRD